MINKIRVDLRQISDNFINLQAQSAIINEIAKLWIQALSNNHKIIFCGNGGSAADAQHLSAELVGKYKLNRNSLPAISLTSNTSIITAISNDYGFEDIFARQIEGIGKSGDVLVGISTSGNSKNVINAFETAKKKGITTVAFTGQLGGELSNFADISLKVPSDVTNNIQEMHIASGHIICDIVEKYFYEQHEYL